MMLRLVLVGVVAALGVSVPSQPSCEHWYESAQAWTTSLLAEWDTWEPQDDGASRLVGTQNPMGCEECRLARMRLLAKSQDLKKEGTSLAQAKDTAKAPEIGALLVDSKAELVAPKPSSPTTFALIDLDDLFETLAADELKRSSDVLTSVGPVPGVSEAPSAAVDASEALESAELGAWGELYRIASEPVAADVEIDRSIIDGLDFQDSDRSCICAFGPSSPSPLAAPEVTAPPVDPAQSKTPAPVQPEDSTSILMSCLEDEFASDADASGVDVAAQEIAAFDELPSDVFASPRVTVSKAADPVPMTRTAEAPIAVAPAASTRRTFPFVLADLPSDLFGPAPGSVEPKPLANDQPLAGAQPQTPRLGDAVELTRRAMSAWVSVLIGPALVDGSRR